MKIRFPVPENVVLVFQLQAVARFRLVIIEGEYL